MSPGKRKLVNGTLDSHFAVQLKKRQKNQMELFLLRGKGKPKAKTPSLSVDPRTRDSWYGGTGSTTGTVTSKASIPSAHAYPLSDDEVMLVKVKASSPKQDGIKRSFRQETQEESKQSDEENIPKQHNPSDSASAVAHAVTARISLSPGASVGNTAAVNIPAVAAPVSQPRQSPPVIDLTDDPSDDDTDDHTDDHIPADVPLPPLEKFYTLEEFEIMWSMAEEDGKYSIEEIEQGSLVRSGNTKVAVRENTRTCVYSTVL
jgi:hypothetical protein